jgi:hypothetical protein
MRFKLLFLSLAGVAMAAASAAAQAAIDPGMTKAQVIAKLGKPAVERAADGSTYLFYRNGSERRVGMNDVVILEDDKVVDAVLRSAARKYTGKSSSPAAIPPEVARRAKATPAPAAVKAPVPAAAPASPTVPGTKPLPAAKAQLDDRATPMPQARSAILEQQKKDADAAAKKAESKPTDPKAAAPAAATPTKKP